MSIIDEELNLVLEEMRANFYEPLKNSELTNFLFNKSKRIRARIALLFINSFSCKPNADVLKILSAGEIIHNASLLHDDVLDDAKERRGEVTINELYSPKISILTGDYLLAFAIKKILEINNNEVVELFWNCTEKMCLAEIEHFYLRGQNVSEEQYLSICKRKTAELFATILESCAIVLNLDRNLARNIGLLFGVVFQIKNDFELNSATQDKINGVSTAVDIWGIEKTKTLLDNYLEEMRGQLNIIPNNIYNEELKDLIINYVKQG